MLRRKEVLDRDETGIVFNVKKTTTTNIQQRSLYNKGGSQMVGQKNGDTRKLFVGALVFFARRAETEREQDPDTD